jgi:hypothetical protein
VEVRILLPEPSKKGFKILKVYTENSIYELDLVNKQYRRTMGDLKHRDIANLVYDAWTPMVSFNLAGTLKIRYPDTECGAFKAGLPCKDMHWIETSRIIKIEQ